MMKTYYDFLPEGYVEIGIVNAESRKFALWMNLAAAVPIVVAVVCILLYCISNNITITLSFSMLTWYFLIFLAYLVLHELTHGIVYSFRTKKKLVFGFNGFVAWCGVKDVYVSRKTALEALLAPFIVFSIVFLVWIFLVSSAQWKCLLILILSAHIGGCAGDLYDSWLLLTKFRNPEILMYDSGPCQIFYGPSSDSLSD